MLNLSATGSARRDDQVDLVVGAKLARALSSSVGEPAGDIFDRAADRVAAVERALRPAQHLDPLDVVNVEHGGLRAVEIDVVEIEADAGLEAGDRILLADAADEGGQGRVGAARVSSVTFGVVSLSSVMSVAPWRSSASPE